MNKLRFLRAMSLALLLSPLALMGMDKTNNKPFVAKATFPITKTNNNQTVVQASMSVAKSFKEVVDVLNSEKKRELFYTPFSFESRNSTSNGANVFFPKGTDLYLIDEFAEFINTQLIDCNCRVGSIDFYSLGSMSFYLDKNSTKDKFEKAIERASYHFSDRVLNTNQELKQSEVPFAQLIYMGDTDIERMPNNYARIIVRRKADKSTINQFNQCILNQLSTYAAYVDRMDEEQREGMKNGEKVYHCSVRFHFHKHMSPIKFLIAFNKAIHQFGN